MLFNSMDFFYFFTAVSVLYFLLPYRFRTLMLLLASCYFYMAFIPVYILILFVTILIDYFAGIYIEKSGAARKKTLLIGSILSTCLVLFVFKYFNFFNANFAAAAKFLHLNYPVPLLNIILPIGLSFHTFQSLSYVVEVYRGRQKAEKNFLTYSLYVMFFPQLVAGPIERPQNLLHQFYEKHDLDYRRITDGLKLMAWGLFKKVVIADRLALLVNQVYNQPAAYEGPALILATVFFAFQIYCDFSGYSDMAIGSAQVLGFRLMKNFDRPYSARSIGEFWKRWHISLSTWFKDYVYIPLGGNRAPRLRVYANLFITFLVSGLWHGANWTFVTWGALNGLYLIAGMATGPVRAQAAALTGLSRFPRTRAAVQIAVTFSLTCFAWIFFRANTMGDAVLIVRNIFAGMGGMLRTPAALLQALGNTGLNLRETGFSLVLLAALELAQRLQRGGSVRGMLAEKPWWIRWPLYYAVIASVVFLSVDSSGQFIYFQF